MNWDSHTRAWKAKASAEGLTKGRWDAWLKLAPATRKQTSQREYAAGKTVKESKYAQLAKRVERKLLKRAVTDYAKRRVLRRFHQMSLDELEWTDKASLAELDARSSVVPAPGSENKWWYR